MELIGETSQFREYKKREKNYLKEWLVYDYTEVYKTGKWAKFQLVAYLVRVYAWAIVSLPAQDNPFILYCCLAAISLGYLGWLVKVRPFVFAFTTARLLLTEFVLLAMSGVMGYYSFYAKYRDQYDPNY